MTNCRKRAFRFLYGKDSVRVAQPCYEASCGTCRSKSLPHLERLLRRSRGRPLEGGHSKPLPATSNPSHHIPTRPGQQCDSRSPRFCHRICFRFCKRRKAFTVLCDRLIESQRKRRINVQVSKRISAMFPFRAFEYAC